MTENPYESPKSSQQSSEQTGTSVLNDDAKEFLGVARHDFWYYPGFALLAVAWFAKTPLLVATLLIASTGFLLVFLWKSFPNYLNSAGLARGTRVYGLFGNVTLIVFQIVTIVVILNR